MVQCYGTTPGTVLRYNTGWPGWYSVVVQRQDGAVLWYNTGLPGWYSVLVQHWRSRVVQCCGTTLAEQGDTLLWYNARMVQLWYNARMVVLWYNARMVQCCGKTPGWYMLWYNTVGPGTSPGGTPLRPGGGGEQQRSPELVASHLLVQGLWPHWLPPLHANTFTRTLGCTHWRTRAHSRIHTSVGPSPCCIR